ncbi:hypothetical protein [Paracoccus jiaweipingae]|uniref:hypothetical protein n=1 Tax=unclassified Paracoccus (in: a-proteobacteria) TaxID=2688777 RepID=UPI00378F1A2B
MKRSFALILLLAACAWPDPDYMGVAGRPVTLDGIRFTVFHRDQQVQVIRHGYLTRAQRAPVQALMMRAAAQATGCRVLPDSLTTKIPGDTGVADLRVDCDGGAI